MSEIARKSALQRALDLEKNHDLNGAVSLARRAISEEYTTPQQAPRELRLLAVQLLLRWAWACTPVNRSLYRLQPYDHPAHWMKKILNWQPGLHILLKACPEIYQLKHYLMLH